MIQITRKYFAHLPRWYYSLLAALHNFDTAFHGSCHKPEHNWVYFHDRNMIECYTGFWLSLCICNELFERLILGLNQGPFLLGPLHYFRVSIPSQLVASIRDPNTSIEILRDPLLMSGSRLHVQLVENFLIQHHFYMLLLYISHAVDGLVCLLFFHHS